MTSRHSTPHSNPSALNTARSTASLSRSPPAPHVQYIDRSINLWIHTNACTFWCFWLSGRVFSCCFALWAQNSKRLSLSSVSSEFTSKLHKHTKQRLLFWRATHTPWKGAERGQKAFYRNINLTSDQIQSLRHKQFLSWKLTDGSSSFPLKRSKFCLKR